MLAIRLHQIIGRGGRPGGSLCLEQEGGYAALCRSHADQADLEDPEVDPTYARPVELEVLDLAW